MINVFQISSLEKVRVCDNFRYEEIIKKTCLKGERFSYQITAKGDERLDGVIEVLSPFGENISVYRVFDAVMDKTVTEEDGIADENYITKEEGLMPDILKPIKEHNNIFGIYSGVSTIWIDVNIPYEIKADTYNITVTCKNAENHDLIFEKNMEIEVCDKEILPQSLIYTRWFYVDCIADYHAVGVYSEEHWALIEEYIKAAADVGINMILVPTHTPPLDTAPSTFRTCVQLVDIEKKGDSYSFDFTKFTRFINICKKCGIKYFEIAHMFSQWGAKYAANIKVSENGKEIYMFGWHTAAQSDEYISFLNQYIAAISAQLEIEGISENTYFHISDEPTMETMETYSRASEIIKPLIGDSKTFDALSEFEFYEKGMVERPVTSIDHLKPFLKAGIQNQWVYYCNKPQGIYTNCFMAMPSARVRILGVLLYKFDIKGFLHWGLNFYNAQISRYKINPYVTTSADGRFPSGDAFILYPSKNGAYNSIRGKVIYDAIEDMKVCQTLEKLIGRDRVIKIIDDAAGMDISFENYPKEKSFLLKLREDMIRIIKHV